MKLKITQHSYNFTFYFHKKLKFYIYKCIKHILSKQLNREEIICIYFAFIDMQSPIICFNVMYFFIYIVKYNLLHSLE